MQIKILVTKIATKIVLKKCEILLAYIQNPKNIT